MKVSVELRKANGQTQSVQVPAFLTKSIVAMELLKQGRLGTSPTDVEVSPKSNKRVLVSSGH